MYVFLFSKDSSDTQGSHTGELHVGLCLWHLSHRGCFEKQHLISITEVVVLVMVVPIFRSTQRSQLLCSDFPSCWLSTMLKSSGVGQGRGFGEGRGQGESTATAHSFVTARLFDIFTSE